MSATKLSEPEARKIILIILRDKGGKATTSEIKDAFPAYYSLSEDDWKTSKSRPNEAHWQQIVGNATASHHASKQSLHNQGYIVKAGDDLELTDKGKAYLVSQGL